MFGLVYRRPVRSPSPRPPPPLLNERTKDGTAINLLSLESCMHIFTKGPHPHSLRHKQKKKKRREENGHRSVIIWWWWWSSVHHFLSLSAREHVVIIHQYKSPFFYNFCPFFTNFTSAAAAAFPPCVLCWFIWRISSSNSSPYKPSSNTRWQTGSNSSSS